MENTITKKQVYNRNGMTVMVYRNPYAEDYVVQNEKRNTVSYKHFDSEAAALSYCRTHALYNSADVRTVAEASTIDKLMLKRTDSRGVENCMANN